MLLEDVAKLYLSMKRAILLRELLLYRLKEDREIFASHF